MHKPLRRDLRVDWNFECESIEVAEVSSPASLDCSVELDQLKHDYDENVVLSVDGRFFHVVGRMSVDGRFTARQPEKLDELEVHPNGLPVGVGGEKRLGEYSPRTDFASRVSVGTGRKTVFLRLQKLSFSVRYFQFAAIVWEKRPS